METLAHELDGLIGAYLRDARTLEDLREWLVDHVQDVLDTPDPRLAELAKLRLKPMNAGASGAA